MTSIKKARKASRFINLHGLRRAMKHITNYFRKHGQASTVSTAANKPVNLWRRIIEFIKGVFTRAVMA
jgi:hypothetical protein